MSNSKNKRRHVQKLLQVAVCNFQFEFGVKYRSIAKKGKTASKAAIRFL
jgi:hypothetical protein